MRLFLFLVISLLNFRVYSQTINNSSPNTYRFKYGSTTFKGSKRNITNQLRTFKENPNYQSIPEEIREGLDQLFLEAKEEVYRRRYKKKAITFLDALKNYEAFILFYNNELYEVIRKLRRDIDKIDFKLEREFTKAKVAYDRIEKENITDKEKINLLEQEYHITHIRLLCHRWMQQKFEDYTTIRCVQQPDHLILEFKKKQASKMFTFFQEQNEDAVSIFLENEIIDFYYKKATLEIDTQGLDLQYINKI